MRITVETGLVCCPCCDMPYEADQEKTNGLLKCGHCGVKYDPVSGACDNPYIDMDEEWDSEGGQK